MTCGYCRYLNLDDEQRCGRCGRRLEIVPRPETPAPPSAPVPPRQVRLFHEGGKVVPIMEPVARPKPRPVMRSSSRVQARHAVSDAQTSLDLLPPAPPAPRTLGTSVEAVIYCDAPVATATHRALAGAIDASMILIAFCLFLVTFYLLGGTLPTGKHMVLIWLGAAAAIAFFYGFVWICCGTPTPGMRATHLTLVNFDGYPPDDNARWLRFLGACIGVCAAGLGVLWALVDEESLAWHDHISQTFPTFRAQETNFVRRS